MTNTLILTNLPQTTLKQPEEILHFLSQGNHTVELVSLPKFGRILVVCDTASSAQEVANALKHSHFGNINISFSMRNNNFSKEMRSWSAESPMDYLELPSESGSRRFLISPPLSPPPEWDHWDKVEEGPNDKPVYSVDELSHLLWERLGEVDDFTVKKHTEDVCYDAKREPQVLFQDISNGAPAIVLDGLGLAREGVKIEKTPMPPMS